MRPFLILACLVAVALPAVGSAESVGAEFQVNSYTTGNQVYSSVATLGTSGDFVVVWQSQDQDGSGRGVFGRRYTSAGTALGAEFQVNSYTTGDQIEAAVAGVGTAGDFVVVWQSPGQDDAFYGVFGQRFSSSGAALGSEFQVNTYTTNAQFAASVAGLGTAGDFVVTWTGPDAYGLGVFGQRFSSSGGALGSEFQVNTYTASTESYSSVAGNSLGDFLVTWSGFNQDGDAQGVYAQRYSSSGSSQGLEFQVNTYTTGAQSQSAVAAAGGSDGFVVTWRSNGQDGSSHGVFGQRYASSGATLGSEFQVNTYVTASQSQPAVAPLGTSGGFVVAWRGNGNQDGSSSGVFAQRYASDGSPKGAEFQVNTQTAYYQHSPAVAGLGTPTGAFVITWNSSGGQDGSGVGVFGQRYAPVTGNVTVTAPLGGDRWGETTTQRIRWTHTTGPGRTWDVALSRDGGGNFTTIGTGIPSNSFAGNLYHDVADVNVCPTTDPALVRVTNTDNDQVADTSALFSIECEPETNVIRPKSTVTVGVQTTVKWTHNTGLQSQIMLLLAKDGDFTGNVSVIASLTKSQGVNKGTFKWTPQPTDCCTTSGSCRIRADWIDSEIEVRKISPAFNVDDGVGGTCPD